MAQALPSVKMSVWRKEFVDNKENCKPTIYKLNSGDYGKM